MLNKQAPYKKIHKTINVYADAYTQFKDICDEKMLQPTKVLASLLTEWSLKNREEKKEEEKKRKEKK